MDVSTGHAAGRRLLRLDADTAEPQRQPSIALAGLTTDESEPAAQTAEADILKAHVIGSL